jgi:hypothetical protein
MLILGGRYGSIDSESGLSYTHWEYQYAEKAGKPRFALVMSDEMLRKKIEKQNLEVIEKNNPDKYKRFKEEIHNKIIKPFSDLKDIRLFVLESIREYENDETLFGWVSGKEVRENQNLQKDNYDLLKENIQLKEQLVVFKKELELKNEINGLPFEEVKKYLISEKVEIPEEAFEGKGAGEFFDVYRLFLRFKDDFATGVTNRVQGSQKEFFLYKTIAPKLMIHNLVESKGVPGVAWQRIKTTPDGFKFLKLALSESTSHKGTIPTV